MRNGNGKIGLFLCLCAALCAAQDRGGFTVGSAAASPGRKVTGFIDVPAGQDADLQIPVVVAHGARPGPVLAIVAGSHGTEYASIIAVEKLIGLLDPGTISGTVILVPLINIPSFEKIVPHVNPVDGKNMNRMYPGTAGGTQTDRASLAVTRQVVDKSDHLIDMHGGDLDESLRPFAYWTRTGNEKQDAISRELVLAFGLDHIVLSADRPKDPEASRYLENTATTRGKPSITVEAGHAGTVEESDVSVLVEGCLNVMRHLGILPGPASRIENPVWLDRLETVAADQGGIFYPLVKRGAYVQKGMRIATVTDFFGKTVSESRAPAAGVVLYVRAVPSLKRGDTVASIGVVATK